MQNSKLKIKDISLDNNIFLAPMAGYTNYAFRKVALECGYSLAFTELVSAKGLAYKTKGNAEIVKCGKDLEKTAVQIFGEDAYYMRKAIEGEYLKDFKIVDINMGCPVPKVFKNGEGSALLLDIKKAENIVKECVKTGKIITVKIRIGQKKGDDIASEYCKMLENAGASLVTIHGRTREEYYSGEPNFSAIEKAKKCVNIPIIANGGIFTKEDALTMINKTGADGVMLARGAIANPFLVCDLLGIEHPFTLKEVILKHLRNAKEEYGLKRPALEFRKFAPWYFKGKLGLSELKKQINVTENIDELIELISENL